jgi:hypothetical protein
MEFLFVVAAVAIAVGIGLTKNRNQSINQAWSNVAQRLDLSLRLAAMGTSPLLTGFVSGHDVAVDIQKKHSGKSRSPWTRFRLGMQPLGLDLKLKNKGFFDRINMAFGTQKIVVGDAAFDDQIVVKGKNETLMREYLTPQRRRSIQHFLGSFPGAVITDDEITVTSRGYARDADEVLRTINAMLYVAQSLSELRDDADQPTLDTQALNDVAPAPEPDAQRDALPAALPEAPAGSPAMAEFRNAVFAPGTLSFDATQTFRKNFEGKRVVWSGTLESASPFAVDFDFGSKGGVRAVLTIDADEAAASAARHVKAVVGLPAGTAGLEDRIGQKVAFAGTLRKVDGFGRKVFVADAELAD